jgi:VWFA-related protein
MALWYYAAASLVLLPAQDRQPPEFRADVDMIRLDVSVVDKSGRPIPGLQPEDFRVLEDGRPVDLAYFQAYVPDADERADDGASPTHVPRRSIVLLADTASMSHGQLLRARESTARYLSAPGRAGDSVRLLNLATREAWHGRMPEDRERLVAAARSLSRRPSPWASVGTDMEAIETREESDVPGMPSEAQTTSRFLSVFAQASDLLGTLESLLVQLEAVEGRKALVLLSTGFPTLRGLDRRLQSVSTLARQASTAVYFVDAAGLDGLLPEPGQRMQPVFEMAWNRSGGASDLAEATGGFTSRFAGTLHPALARVAAEMRTYYVLGYLPPRAQDGRFRSVKVEVTRSGLTARTKKGYLAVPRGS